MPKGGEDDPKTSPRADLFQIDDLDVLIARGCKWAGDYLHNKPESDSDRTLCDDTDTTKEAIQTEPVSTVISAPSAEEQNEKPKPAQPSSPEPKAKQGKASTPVASPPRREPVPSSHTAPPKHAPSTHWSIEKNDKID